MPEQLTLLTPSNDMGRHHETPVVGRITFAPTVNWSDQRAPAAPGSDTSIAAAYGQSESHRSTIRERIFQHIQGSDTGATREEISIEVGIRLATVCARVSELLASGRIKRGGQRETTSGTMAEVLWVR